MDKFDRVFEQFKVQGRDLVEKVRELIHEGNVRRIIVRDENGHTFMEIPLSVAAVGVVAVPVLAAVGAIATIVSKFDVAVERTAPPSSGTGDGAKTGAASTGSSRGGSKVTDSSVGAREEQMDMAGTVPEHSDNKGTKLEDLAGTGDHDSLGG